MAKTDKGIIKIGWAGRDITPEKKASLRGQFHLRISKGVKDRLTVTALALSTDGPSAGSVIFVSCDNVGLSSNEIIELCREKVRAKNPLIDTKCIVMNVTHSHTAPGFLDRQTGLPPGVLTCGEYSMFFAERAAEAVVEAWAKMKPGGISWGLGTAVVGHNRRATYFDNENTAGGSGKMKGLIENGVTKMYGNTNDPNFSHLEGYEDHYVDLLYTWDKKKKLTGVVVNLACPSQVSEQDYYISADFWNEIRIGLKKREGKGLFILPQCSAAGDQSPHLLWYKKAEERMLKLRKSSMREEISRRVVETVDEVLPLAKKDIRYSAVLKHTAVTIALPKRIITREEAAVVRADLAKLEKEGPGKNKNTYVSSIIRCKNAIERYEKQKSEPDVPMEMHVVRLGDVAFATNRYEYFLDYGIRIKAQSPADQTFVIQLAGDTGGTYLPTAKAVAGKGYGGGVYDNIVGPEAGQKIVEETVKQINDFWKQ